MGISDQHVSNASLRRAAGLSRGKSQRAWVCLCFGAFSMWLSACAGGSEEMGDADIRKVTQSAAPSATVDTGSPVCQVLFRAAAPISRTISESAFHVVTTQGEALSRRIAQASTAAGLRLSPALPEGTNLLVVNRGIQNSQRHLSVQIPLAEANTIAQFDFSEEESRDSGRVKLLSVAHYRLDPQQPTVTFCTPFAQTLDIRALLAKPIVARAAEILRRPGVIRTDSPDYAAARDELLELFLPLTRNRMPTPEFPAMAVSFHATNAVDSDASQTAPLAESLVLRFANLFLQITSNGPSGEPAVEVRYTRPIRGRIRDALAIQMPAGGHEMAPGTEALINRAHLGPARPAGATQLRNVNRTGGSSATVQLNVTSPGSTAGAVAWVSVTAPPAGTPCENATPSNAYLVGNFSFAGVEVPGVFPLEFTLQELPAAGRCVSINTLDAFGRVLAFDHVRIPGA